MALSITFPLGKFGLWFRFKPILFWPGPIPNSAWFTRQCATLFNSSCTKLDIELAALQALQAPSACRTGAGAIASLPGAVWMPRRGLCLPHLHKSSAAKGRGWCVVLCALSPSALMWGKPLLCLRLRWGLIEHWLPPLQLLLALSCGGVWAFHPLQRGQEEPKQNTLLT